MTRSGRTSQVSGALSYKEAIPDSPRVGVRFEIVPGLRVGVEAGIYCRATLSYSTAHLPTAIQLKSHPECIIISPERLPNIIKNYVLKDIHSLTI